MRIKKDGHCRVVSEQLYKSKYKAMGYEVVEEKKEITEDDIKEITEELTLPELKKIAKAREIKGYSSMDKEKLIEALK